MTAANKSASNDNNHREKDPGRARPSRPGSDLQRPALSPEGRAWADEHVPRPGDLLGFSSSTCLGLTINLGTFGVPWRDLSHVALVAAHPSTGEPILFESTTLVRQPCLMTGRRTSGVQAHIIGRRVRRYRGRVWHYRLAEPLGVHKSKLLTLCCCRMLGTPYDALGAFRSRGLSLIEKFIFRAEDLVSIFCSEFCAAQLREIDVLHMDNASRMNPNKLARLVVRFGVHRKPRRWK